MTQDLFFDEVPSPYVAPQAIAPGAFLLRGFACEHAEALLRAVEQVTASAPLRHLVTPGGRVMSVAMSNCGELGWVSDQSGYRYTPTDPLSGHSWPAMPDCFVELAARAIAEYAKCQAWGPANAAPGRPRQVQPPRGAAQHTQWQAWACSSQASQGRGTGFAGPQAQRPPRGAAQHTQWQAWGLHFRPDACLINSYEPGSRLSLHQDRDEGDMTAPIVSVSLGLPAIFLFGTNQRADRPARLRLAHGDVAVWGGPARLAYHGIAPLADGDHVLLGRRRINLTFRCAGRKRPFP